MLYGSDEAVHVRYKNRYGRQRAYYDDVRGRRSRTSSAGTMRPTPTRRASAWSSSCARSRAGRARARGCEPETLAVTIGGKNISQMTDLAIREALAFTDEWGSPSARR